MKFHLLFNTSFPVSPSLESDGLIPASFTLSDPLLMLPLYDYKLYVVVCMQLCPTGQCKLLESEEGLSSIHPRAWYVATDAH